MNLLPSEKVELLLKRNTRNKNSLFHTPYNIPSIIEQLIENESLHHNIFVIL
jgi:hypothetical protein